jgi:hypothetical protein
MWLGAIRPSTLHMPSIGRNMFNIQLDTANCMRCHLLDGNAVRQFSDVCTVFEEFCRVQQKAQPI